MIRAEHAPLCFVYALTGHSFGVLNPYEQFTIFDDYFPYMLVMFGLYAICYAVRACRVRRVAPVPGLGQANA